MKGLITEPGSFDEEIYGKPSLPAEDTTQQKPDKDKPKTPTIAEVLLNIVAAEAILFQDHHGTAWARVRGKCWPVRSTPFRRFLQRQYYHATGKPPGGQAFKDAIDQIEGEALFETHREPMPVNVRASYSDGKIFIDLADEAGTIIEVSADGWSVSTTDTTYFWKPSGMEALPVPESGGSIDDLKPFLNYKNEADFRLTVAYMLAALNPSLSCPALNFQGEQGSAKTTNSKAIRSLTDPNAAPVRSAPREERELIIQANNSRVICLDNLSGMKGWLSDALCRIITGGGFSTRKLYSDNEEQIFSVRRPIILNGIDDIATRGDLLDRSIVLNLPAIPQEKRKDERLFWREFQEARPYIFGVLLDALAYGLSNPVKLDRLPRMADFAEWVAACEGAFGWSQGTLLADYNRNRGQAVETGLDSDNLASAIRKIMADKSQASYTATELIEKIEQVSGDVDKRYLPTTRTLKSRLTRLSPALRQVGITWDRERIESGTRYVIRKGSKDVQDVQDLQDPLSDKGLDNGRNLAQLAESKSSARNMQEGNPLGDNEYCTTGTTGRKKDTSLSDDWKRQAELEGYSINDKAPF